ncbi:MAG: Rha family transcriptional regulator [Burkholderiaceae bacterium]|jgi:Rha family phage regulatory protein|nr:Rha family transcriptional regulator [Burkholderiaceae bacterium]
MKNRDLFPETLLVQRQGEHIYTTSLKVAEFSKKRHTEVLRAIETKLEVLPEDFRQRNFASANYLDRQKKPRQMYEMTEEGFALTMMGFTGPKAVQWQVDFIEAFMAQRAALMQITARYAHALDMVRPSLRPVVEGTERGLRRTAIAGPLGKSANAITYHRRQARHLGLLAWPRSHTQEAAA